MKHTPGPWRWEINEKHKSISLCGGKPIYDLEIMSFGRWGFGGAIPLVRHEEGHLEKANTFATISEGREHHADWFKVINHPDMNLIAAARELFDILKEMMYSGIGEMTLKDIADMLALRQRAFNLIEKLSK